MRREAWHIKSVLIVEINPSVLESPDISLEMPDHKIYRFEGGSKSLASQGSPDSFFWKGTVLAGGVPSSSPSNIAIGRRFRGGPSEPAP
jgi:hypothetical protein